MKHPDGSPDLPPDPHPQVGHPWSLGAWSPGRWLGRRRAAGGSSATQGLGGALDVVMGFSDGEELGELKRLEDAWIHRCIES